MGILKELKEIKKELQKISNFLELTGVTCKHEHEDSDGMCSRERSRGNVMND